MPSASPEQTVKGEAQIEFSLAEPEQLQSIFELRRETLQQNPDMLGDIEDMYDQTAMHGLARAAGSLVGAGRVFHLPVEGIGEAQVGHITVKKEYRNRGIAARLLDYLEVKTLERFGQVETIYLTAEQQAISLYERAGYTSIQDPYNRDLEGLMLMRKTLSHKADRI